MAAVRSRSWTWWLWPVPVVVWLVVAGGLFARWELEGWFPPTGDEPHYLVMARGLAEDGAVEQSGPYAAEQRDPEFGLGPKDRHVARTADGRIYSFHGLGLPLLLAPAEGAGGPIGAKALLVALGSVVVLLAWRVAHRRLPAGPALLVSVAVGVALPFLFAANQVYPDLVAGVIALVVVVEVAEPRATGTARALGDLGLAALIGFLPWLQVKFLPVAALCAVAVLVAGGSSPRWRRPAVAAVMALAVGGALVFNQLVFGRLSGPYDGDAGQVSWQALTVLLGLHLDRFHGMFLMHPLLLVGAFETVRRCARRVPWAWLVLGLWAAFVVPNAMHPVWFGGLSMAGRFSWAAAVVLTYPTVRGLCALYRRSAWLTGGLVVLSIALQSAYVVQLWRDRFDLYNNQLAWKVSWVRSLHGALRTSMPALYDADRAWGFAPNTIAVGLLLVLVLVAVVVGLAQGSDRPERPRAVGFRWEPLAPDPPVWADRSPGADQAPPAPPGPSGAGVLGAAPGPAPPVRTPR